MSALAQGESSDTVRTGDCFQAAARFIQRREIIKYPDGYRLVHGNVAALPQYEAVNHAWVEEGDLVHEVSDGRSLVVDKKHYYQAHRVTKVRAYTVMEALCLCIQHGHWGPWD